MARTVTGANGIPPSDGREPISAVNDTTGVDGTSNDLTDIAGNTSENDTGVFNPASLGNSGATGNVDGQPPKRGRGRPKGSGTGKSSGSKTGGKTKSASATTDSIASALFSVHMMGSAMLKIQELALTDQEAKDLAAALVGVSEHYDIPLMDDKSAAWLKLIMVGGGIYGTRVASMVMTNKAKKGPVTVFPPNGRPVAV